MQDRLLLLGKKIGMTQLFDANNCLLPVTVILAEPCYVSQVKTLETDGYNATQIAYDLKNHLCKAATGHLKKAHIDQKLAKLKEFTVNESAKFELGQALSVDAFEEGQKVDVVADSKGKGFQGVVKRHGFKGGRATHGSMSHRRGGSYGHFRRMGHVTKNQKMPGHMGCERRTVQNLVVIKVIPEKNLILVKGSVPGPKGSWVMVRKAKKA